MKYEFGDKVIVHSFEGYILKEYLPDMYEVRLQSGDIVVPIKEIKPLIKENK